MLNLLSLSRRGMVRIIWVGGRALKMGWVTGQPHGACMRDWVKRVGLKITSAFPPGPGLAYCRHLSTVRTHLSALVNHMIVSPDLPCDAGQGLTASIWEQYIQDSTVSRAGLVHQRAVERGRLVSSDSGTQVDVPV